MNDKPLSCFTSIVKYRYANPSMISISVFPVLFLVKTTVDQ